VNDIEIKEQEVFEKNNKIDQLKEELSKE